MVRAWAILQVVGSVSRAARSPACSITDAIYLASFILQTLTAARYTPSASAGVGSRSCLSTSTIADAARQTSPPCPVRARSAPYCPASSSTTWRSKNASARSMAKSHRPALIKIRAARDTSSGRISATSFRNLRRALSSAPKHLKVRSTGSTPNIG